jgi:hypothetical protein
MMSALCPWLWLNCEECQHYAPLACAVAAIRWGPRACTHKLESTSGFGGKTDLIMTSRDFRF